MRDLSRGAGRDQLASGRSHSAKAGPLLQRLCQHRLGDSRPPLQRTAGAIRARDLEPNRRRDLADDAVAEFD